MIRIIIFIGFIVSIGCGEQRVTPEAIPVPIEVTWEIDSISTSPASMTYATYHIKNLGGQALIAGQWSLHFNQIGGRPHKNHIPSNITFENPSGDYLTMTINENLASGEELSISYGIGGFIDKMSETPRGLFVVIEGNPSSMIAINTEGINPEILAKLNPATDASRYEEYKHLSVLPSSQLLPFIPSPQQHKVLDGVTALSSTVRFNIPTELDGLIESIGNHQLWLGAKFKISKSDADILIRIDNNIETKAEGYKLIVSDNNIVIIGKDKQGAFYGTQSILQLLYHNQKSDGSFELNNLDVTDYPRFAYRGFHLDVSRNFHSVEAVKKILDMMAFFKLNKFHFHLTDDEGWRLEIPGLPELTTIGAHRGYTEDEHDHLHPSYGSGPDPTSSYGSGYYTVQDFKDILQYAQQRQIEVIPEIDLPGHARAAIKAMEARYRRYIEEDNSIEANRYLLSDAEDQSKYGSAQGYDDNVICVCQEGADMDHIASIPELPVNFISQMRAILDRHDITIAGWEEIMLVHSNEGHNTIEINHSMIDGKMLPYVWNAVWGWGREDMIYRLANAGSPVVMANSAAFYFDMAYDKSPNEIGLSWSGFANTKTAYGLDPLDMFKNARLDVRGQPLDPEFVAGMTRITAEGKKNFKGIQSQLWSETVIAEKWLDYLMYPKMFGFAERAWI